MDEMGRWRLVDDRPDRDRYVTEIGEELVAEVYYDEQPDDRDGWFWRIEGRDGQVNGIAASFEDAREEVRAHLAKRGLVTKMKGSPPLL